MPTRQQLHNFEGPRVLPSLQGLSLHVCRVEQEETLSSLFAILSRLGTLKRLTKMLRPIVTEQLLEVVKQNKHMTHLSLRYFEETAFPRLCGVLSDPEHSLRSLQVVLDARTHQEIERYDSGNDDSDNDDVGSNSSDESEDDESSDEDTEGDTVERHTRKSAGNHAAIFLESDLALALRKVNVNLTECRIERSYKSGGAKNTLPVSLDLCREVEYYLRLNASGRRQARGDCKTALVKALWAVIRCIRNRESGWKQHPELYALRRFDNDCDDADSRLDSQKARQDRDRLQLLFGLLREAPSLWSDPERRCSQRI